MVTEFPMFEEEKDDSYLMPIYHQFTAPKTDSIESLNLMKKLYYLKRMI